MKRAATLLAAALVLASAGGCTVIAVGGALVGATVAVGTVPVKTGVAVTKGAVNVATYPFRDSEEEKQQEKQQKALEQQQAEQKR